MLMLVRFDVDVVFEAARANTFVDFPLARLAKIVRQQAS